MPREFVPFDEQVIDAEFAALGKASPWDRAKLDYCVGRYEQSTPHENPSPAFVKNFEEGFKELRHVKDEYAGRLLFYEPPGIKDGFQELVML